MNAANITYAVIIGDSNGFVNGYTLARLLLESSDETSEFLVSINEFFYFAEDEFVVSYFLAENTLLCLPLNTIFFTIHELHF